MEALLYYNFIKDGQLLGTFFGSISVHNGDLVVDYFVFSKNQVRTVVHLRKKHNLETDVFMDDNYPNETQAEDGQDRIRRYYENWLLRESRDYINTVLNIYDYKISNTLRPRFLWSDTDTLQRKSVMPKIHDLYIQHGEDALVFFKDGVYSNSVRDLLNYSINTLGLSPLATF